MTRQSYRGYYYDTETGFYYLNARYYDPELRRFISADDQISGVGESVIGYNLFAYCNNNPVGFADYDGHMFSRTKETLKNIAIGAAAVATSTAAVATGVCAGAGTVLAVGNGKGSNQKYICRKRR